MLHLTLDGLLLMLHMNTITMNMSTTMLTSNSLQSHFQLGALAKVVARMLHLTLDPLLLPERGVLTRLSWLRRLNTMMLLSVNIPTARSVTPLTPLTLSPNRRKNVRRTSSRAVLLNTR